MSDGTAGGVSGMNDSTPLATALSRHYGTSNQYGNDPNHAGFAGGVLNSMKTGVEGTMGLVNMQNFIKQRQSSQAIKSSQAKPTITRTGSEPI